MGYYLGYPDPVFHPVWCLKCKYPTLWSPAKSRDPVCKANQTLFRSEVARTTPTSRHLPSEFPGACKWYRLSFFSSACSSSPTARVGSPRKTAGTRRSKSWPVCSATVIGITRRSLRSTRRLRMPCGSSVKRLSAVSRPWSPRECSSVCSWA